MKKKTENLDYEKLADLEIDGLNSWDHPDYCDAFIATGLYEGRDLTDDELDQLNEDAELVAELVNKRIY